MKTIEAVIPHNQQHNMRSGGLLMSNQWTFDILFRLKNSSKSKTNNEILREEEEEGAGKRRKKVII